VLQEVGLLASKGPELEVAPEDVAEQARRAERGFLALTLDARSRLAVEIQLAGRACMGGAARLSVGCIALEGLLSDSTASDDTMASRPVLTVAAGHAARVDATAVNVRLVGVGDVVGACSGGACTGECEGAVGCEEGIGAPGTAARAGTLTGRAQSTPPAKALVRQAVLNGKRAETAAGQCGGECSGQGARLGRSGLAAG
jgi:hypothetical protein